MTTCSFNITLSDCVVSAVRELLDGFTGYTDITHSRKDNITSDLVLFDPADFVEPQNVTPRWILVGALQNAGPDQIVMRMLTETPIPRQTTLNPKRFIIPLVERQVHQEFSRSIDDVERHPMIIEPKFSTSL
jgi:hypothetical protein